MLQWSIQLRLSSENHHFLDFGGSRSIKIPALSEDLELQIHLFFWFLNIFRIMHPRTILHVPGRFQGHYRPHSSIFEPSESSQTDFLRSSMWILVPQPPVKGVSNFIFWVKNEKKSCFPHRGGLVDYSAHSRVLVWWPMILRSVWGWVSAFSGIPTAPQQLKIPKKLPGDL